MRDVSEDTSSLRVAAAQAIVEMPQEVRRRLKARFLEGTPIKNINRHT